MKISVVIPVYNAENYVLQAVESALQFDEVYEVKKGDSLSKIAKHYNTTWQKIFEMNKDTIKNADLIFPGQKIKVPK